MRHQKSSLGFLDQGLRLMKHDTEIEICVKKERKRERDRKRGREREREREREGEREIERERATADTHYKVRHPAFSLSPSLYRC